MERIAYLKTLRGEGKTIPQIREILLAEKDPAGDQEVLDPLTDGIHSQITAALCSFHGEEPDAVQRKFPFQGEGSVLRDAGIPPFPGSEQPTLADGLVTSPEGYSGEPRRQPFLISVGCF